MQLGQRERLVVGEGTLWMMRNWNRQTNDCIFCITRVQFRSQEVIVISPPRRFFFSSRFFGVSTKQWKNSCHAVGHNEEVVVHLLWAQIVIHGRRLRQRWEFVQKCHLGGV